MLLILIFLCINFNKMYKLTADGINNVESFFKKSKACFILPRIPNLENI